MATALSSDSHLRSDVEGLRLARTIANELGAASAVKAAERVRRAGELLALEENALDGKRTATVFVTVPVHANTSFQSVVGRRAADAAQASLTEHGVRLPLPTPNLDLKHPRQAAERELAPHTQP